MYYFKYFFIIFVKMYYYGVEHRKKVTKYSEKFSSKRKAKLWYSNYGKKLEKKFNRQLELFIK